MTGRLAFRRRQVSARLFLLRRLGTRHAVRRLRLKRRWEHAAAGNAQASETMWRQAAAKLDVRVRRVSTSLLEFELDGTFAHVLDQTTTPFTDRVADAIARDKPTAYEALARAGVPVPEHVAVAAGDLTTARAFLARMGPPLLVKPATGGGGAGVVGNVVSPAQLERALDDVGRYDDTVLVERQVDGTSYRLLLLDGEVLDALRKRLPSISGDGSSTVERLLLHEYERRLAAGAEPAGYPPLEADADTLFALDRAGVGLRTVLPIGAVIVVKSASNFAAPDGVETLTSGDVAGIVSPARAAAAALGVRLAGVDVVTVDPQQPLADSCVVVEVNSAPGLMQHYNVANPGAATPVAEIVLASMLRRRND